MPFCDTGQMGNSNSLATLYSLSGRVESAVTKQQTNDCGSSMNKGQMITVISVMGTLW